MGLPVELGRSGHWAGERSGLLTSWKRRERCLEKEVAGGSLSFWRRCLKPKGFVGESEGTEVEYGV